MALASISLLAIGCNAPDSAEPAIEPGQSPLTEELGPSGPSAAQCSQAFTRRIQPLRIDGHKHLYFDSSSLEFLLDPSLRIDSIIVEYALEGDRKNDKNPPGVSLNGLQAFSSDNFPFFSFLKYSSASNSSQCNLKLDKLRLNGSDLFNFAMFKIINSKGQVRLSLHGQNFKIQDAELVVTGRDLDECGPGPSPSPSPSSSPLPPPVAPQTFISAVEPAGSPVASTTISFSLSSNQIGVSYECSLDDDPALPCASPQIYSNLANGAHSFRVKATNAAGLTDPVGAFHAWTVDSVPPSVNLLNVGSLPSVTNSMTMTVEFEAADASATSFRCSLDGQAFADCASPISYFGLAEGSHSISVTARDAAGNISLSPAVFQWSVDLTPPETHFTLAQPPEPVTSANSLALSFGANETSSFECSIDQGVFQACSSPLSVEGLADGAHSVEVRATDLAGNVGPVATYFWSVDTGAPVLALGATLPSSGITNARMISVEFSASEPASFFCSLDGAPAEACSSPFSSPIFAEGNHELAISARDQAGNPSAVARVAWIMDFTLPELSWGLISPSAASFIRSTDFSAEVQALESVRLTSTLNLIDLGQSASPIALSALVEGRYDLAVFGTDLAGNAGPAITHGFTVDLTAPVVALSGAHADGALTRETVNELSFSADEAASFECDLDGAGFSACVSPVLISGLADGPHAFQVRATDLAGNASSVASVSWLVDVTPPVTALVAERTQNTSISFSFTADEPVSGFECSLDGGAYSSCASPLALTGLATGAHVFSVRATDLAGNVGIAPTNHAFTVDPPVTTSIVSKSPSASVTNSTSMSIAFGSNQAGGAKFLCSLDGAAEAPCVSPVSYSGLGSGNHHFVVRAIDNWGMADPIGAGHSWTVDTAPPVVVTFTPVGGSYSVTVNWTTDEPATSKINYGLGSDTSRVVAEDSVYKTSHSVKISGLSSGTIYSFIVSGRDQAGNTYVSLRKTARTY